MKKIFEFVKEYWMLIMIGVAIVLYIVSLFVKGPPGTGVSPTPTPNNKVATYKNIVPGTSTEKDVTSVWGRPVTSETSNGQTVSDYRSTNQYRFHQVIYTNGTAKLLKEIVNSNDNINSDYITGTYGTTKYKLYEKYPHSSFNLYVYPTNGIAYLGHVDGTVKEIWYFEPTTFDNFVSLWAQDFSTTPVDDSTTY